MPPPRTVAVAGNPGELVASTAQSCRLVRVKPGVVVVAPEGLIYLAQMTGYARAERGQRVQHAVSGGHLKMLTILGATSEHGRVAAGTVEAATAGEVFGVVYLSGVVCLKLWPATSS